MIAFVQPFGLNSPGGGARIFRALLGGAADAAASLPFVSICTDNAQPPETTIGREIHLPIRPHLGRLEGTRVAGRWGYVAESALSRRFVKRLCEIIRAQRCAAVHGLAHGMDFWYAYQAANELGLPFYLSVHDDLAYALKGRPELEVGLRRLDRAWRDAAERFVISDAMGVEYCRRYGTRSYEVVTDGLERVPALPLKRQPSDLRIYFMGLLHRSYTDNFRALLSAAAEIRQSHPDVNVSVTCRCGSLPRELDGLFPVTLLPFASEADVARDLESADVLYLPLPFGAEYELFFRYSLSTKMITYLGSGLPILYHGPRESAAGQLLSAHRAAVAAESLDPSAVARKLLEVVHEGPSAAARALELAGRQFLLAEQRRRFHQGLARHERPRRPVPAKVAV